MLRKAEEHLTNQRQFEFENQARLETARRIRQAERDRQDVFGGKCSLSPSRLSLHLVCSVTNGRFTN